MTGVTRLYMHFLSRMCLEEICQKYLNEYPVNLSASVGRDPLLARCYQPMPQILKEALKPPSVISSICHHLFKAFSIVAMPLFSSHEKV